MTIPISGGGGAPTLINGFIGFDSQQILIETNDGQAYLATGFIETDIASYPDAQVVAVYDPDGSETVLDIESSTISPRAVAFDGTLFWVIDTGRRLYSYNAAGVEQSNISVSGALATAPQDMDFNNAGNLLCAQAGEIREITTAGVLVNTFSTAPAPAVGTVIGVAYDSATEDTYFLASNTFWKANSDFTVIQKLFLNTVVSPKAIFFIDGTLLSAGTGSLFSSAYPSSVDAINQYTSSYTTFDTNDHQGGNYDAVNNRIIRIVDASGQASIVFHPIIKGVGNPEDKEGTTNETKRWKRIK